MRRSSALVATDPRGRVLMQLRTDDAPSWPAHLGLFGGAEEEGETPERALLRELREELDLDVSGAVQVGRLVLDGFAEGSLCLTAFYLALDHKRADPRALRESMREGQDLGFFRLQDLMGMAVVPHDLAVVELVLRNLRSPWP